MRLSSIRFDRHRRTRGQSVVEFALILPVMLILMATAVDLGRVLYSQITITNAAKEGALVASQGGTFQSGQGCSDTNTVMCGVLTEAEGGFVEVDQARVDLSPAVCEKNAMWPSTGAPPTVTVSVEAPFRVLTPIIGNIIGNNLLLSASADAQCMAVPAVTYPQLPAPVAAFTANPTAGPAPLTVNLNASASTSTGSTITSYAWSFGATGVTASNTYNTAGTYTITLTITDSRGMSDTEQQTITVGGGGPGPTCPTVSFTATDRSSNGNPHRMDLNATLAPSTSGWSWAWSGTPELTAITQNVNNFDFLTGGAKQITVTATKGTCTVTTTQTVTVP